MRFEVWNISRNFRLSGVPLYDMCVVFNQGYYVFVLYNLLKGCCEWILIEPWIQLINYSLTGLTWQIRLRIGISHLSISGIVVHGRYYIFHCFYFSSTFYDCLLFDLSFFFLFSCLLTVIWATRNLFQLISFRCDWSLNFVIIIINSLCYSILYY